MYQHEANKLGNRISEYEHNQLIGLKTQMEKAGETENKKIEYPVVVRNPEPAPTGMPPQKVELETHKKKMKTGKKQTKWGKGKSNFTIADIEQMTLPTTGQNGEQPAVNGLKGDAAQIANSGVVSSTPKVPWMLLLGLLFAVLFYIAYQRTEKS